MFKCASIALLLTTVIIPQASAEFIGCAVASKDGLTHFTYVLDFENGRLASDLVGISEPPSPTDAIKAFHAEQAVVTSSLLDFDVAINIWNREETKSPTSFVFYAQEDRVASLVIDRLSRKALMILQPGRKTQDISQKYYRGQCWPWKERLL